MRSGRSSSFRNHSACIGKTDSFYNSNRRSGFDPELTIYYYKRIRVPKPLHAGTSGTARTLKQSHVKILGGRGVRSVFRLRYLTPHEEPSAGRFPEFRPDSESGSGTQDGLLTKPQMQKGLIRTVFRLRYLLPHPGALGNNLLLKPHKPQMHPAKL